MAEEQQKANSGTDSGRMVVIAMDGSEPSDHAFNWYMDHVHKPDDHVIFAHSPEFHSVVAAPMPVADATLFTEMWKEEEKRVEHFLEVLGHKLTDHKIGGKVIGRRGKAGEVVCAIAKENHADLIVVGNRGHGKIRRTFLGSVSDYVMDHSHCPVIVVKDKDYHHHDQHHPQEKH